MGRGERGSGNRRGQPRSPASPGGYPALDRRRPRRRSHPGSQCQGGPCCCCPGGPAGPEREGRGASWGWRGAGPGSLAGPRSSLWMGVGSVAAGSPIWWEWGSWPGARGSSATTCPSPLPPRSLEPCLPCGLTPRGGSAGRGDFSLVASPRWARSVPTSGVCNTPSQEHFVTVTSPGSQ